MRTFLPELLLVGLPTFVVAALVLLIRDWRARRRLLREQRWRDGDEEDSTTLIEKIAAARPPTDWRGRMDYDFARMAERTGFTISPGQLLGVIVMAGLLPALGLYLWRGQGWLPLVGFFVGVLLALLVLGLLQGRWRRVVQNQLPDAFFLLARSLRAGLSLEEALGTVAQHGLKPLAGEFQRCVGHIQLGMTVTGALQMMAARLRLADFNGLVSIVALHRMTGGNLPFLLDRWAASTRDRNQFRGYFRAATALGRITALALAAAIPFLLIGYWILQPDYLIRFAQSSTGLTALSVVAVLEVVGALWVFSLTRVDY
jgi:tight adherence protein B